MRIFCGLLALLLGALAAPPARAEPPADGALVRSLTEGAAEASVLTLSESGDLVLFGGAIVVPARRPSVEACGEWIATPLADRPARLAALRKGVAERAGREGWSQKDRFEAQRKATEPQKQCEALLAARCASTLSGLEARVRAAAIADVERAVERLVDAELKAAIRANLAAVLDQCPLGR
jgi:hypothetical protein